MQLFESTEDYFEKIKEDTNEDILFWVLSNIEHSELNVDNDINEKFVNTLVKKFNISNSTAESILKDAAKEVMNESTNKLKELRSLILVQIWYDPKGSFSLNFPGGSKVFYGTPIEFISILRKLGAADAKTFPRSNRTITYSEIVDRIIKGQDNAVYIWSNKINDLKGIEGISNFKEEKEDYKVSISGD